MYGLLQIVGLFVAKVRLVCIIFRIYNKTFVTKYVDKPVAIIGSLHKKNCAKEEERNKGNISTDICKKTFLTLI